MSHPLLIYGLEEVDGVKALVTAFEVSLTRLLGR
jgi:hypothetical protein